jgi:hypothetical protein
MFESLKGREVQIPGEQGVRRFTTGAYPNGRPALGLEVEVREDGEVWWEPDMMLTVNLPDEPLPEGCFFVRSHNYEDCLQRILATGLFDDLGVDVPAGFVAQYARVWRLRPTPAGIPN